MTQASRSTSLLLSILVFAALSCSEKQATEPKPEPQGPPPGSAGDSTAPSISQIEPGENATGVPRGTVVRAAFSEPIEASTATTGTFRLEGPGSTAVSGSVSASGSTITFTPGAPLEGETAYTATVTTGIHDLAGNALESPRSWSFTTAGQSPVANAGPDQNVDAGATVVLDGTASFDPDGKALSFRWDQTGGADVTGGAGYLTGPEPSFTAPSVATTIELSLVVSDGVESSQPDVVRIFVSVTEHGVYVHPGGSDSNPGTRAAPLQTVAAAIQKASAGAVDVYIAHGTYTQTEFTLLSNVNLYGGYDDTFQSRDPSANPTILVGGTTALTASSGVSHVKVDGVTIRSAAATASGGSSIAVLLRGASDVSFNGCVIEAGNGARGQDGGPGGAGATGAAGSVGEDGDCNDYTNPSAGGAGGGSGAAQGGAGGAGGVVASTFVGGTGESGSGPAGGDGGAGGKLSQKKGDGGHAGGAGTPGGNGAGGASFGDWRASGYLPAPGVNGADDGTPGSGGGGGGGSSGSVGTENGSGNGGGGGGGGGAPGSGGTAGAGGGGSFAIAIDGSTDIVVQGCTLRTGQGGAGGGAGRGGEGGSGGVGGPGARACQRQIGPGGNGGAGGSGGRGGHGGGGGGGPTVGIVWDTASTLTESGNTYSLGSAGAGGTSLGVAGSSGAREEILRR
jgi:hypothetical protein